MCRFSADIHLSELWPSPKGAALIMRGRRTRSSAHIHANVHKGVLAPACTEPVWITGSVSHHFNAPDMNAASFPSEKRKKKKGSGLYMIFLWLQWGASEAPDDRTGRALRSLLMMACS